MASLVTYTVHGRETAHIRKEALDVASALLAAAEKSPDTEAWISRQLSAGQKPSQILAELGQGGHADV